MRIIRGLIDRFVLVSGSIVGGTVASFVAQYRQRIGGALDQVVRDLAPFQEIANQFYNGSLLTLVQHHIGSRDLTFQREGAAITAMIESEQRLRAANQALNADLFHQISYLLTNAELSMLSATWAIFKPSFGISIDSLVVAGIVGISAWMLFMGLWYALAAGLGGVMNRRKRHAYY